MWELFLQPGLGENKYSLPDLPSISSQRLSILSSSELPTRIKGRNGLHFLLLSLHFVPVLHPQHLLFRGFIPGIIWTLESSDNNLITLVIYQNRYSKRFAGLSAEIIPATQYPNQHWKCDVSFFKNHSFHRKKTVCHWSSAIIERFVSCSAGAHDPVCKAKLMTPYSSVPPITHRLLCCMSCGAQLRFVSVKQTPCHFTSWHRAFFLFFFLIKFKRILTLSILRNTLNNFRTAEMKIHCHVMINSSPYVSGFGRKAHISCVEMQRR